jgi:hypothetical protein
MGVWVVMVGVQINSQGEEFLQRLGVVDKARL